MSRNPWSYPTFLLAFAGLAAGLAFTVPCAAHSAEPTAPLAEPPLDPATFARQVVERNPALMAEASMLEAARARARGAGGRPEPMASVGLAPLSLSPEAERPGLELGLGKAFPTSGAPRLERKAAEASAAAASADLEVMRLDMALEAFDLAEDRWLADRAVARVDEQARVASDVSRATLAALASGTARRGDVLAAEQGIEELGAEREMLVGARSALEAEMNALLDRPPQAPLPPAGAAELVFPAAEAEPRREEITAATERLHSARSEDALARRSYAPDLFAMASYSTMWDMPEHRLMVGVSAELPLATRARRGDIDEAAAMVAALSHEEQALRAEVAAEVHAARAEAEAARAVASRHRDRILPLARQRLESERAAFASGNASYLQLSDALSEWIEAERAADESASAARRAEARLLRALGQFPGGAR